MTRTIGCDQGVVSNSENRAYGRSNAVNLTISSEPAVCPALSIPCTMLDCADTTYKHAAHWAKRQAEVNA
jgi:hypothetical protein